MNSRTPTRFPLRDEISRKQESEPCAFNLAWQPPQSCLNGPFRVFNHIAQTEGIPQPNCRIANLSHQGSEVRCLLGAFVSVVEIFTYASPNEKGNHIHRCRLVHTMASAKTTIAVTMAAPAMSNE